MKKTKLLLSAVVVALLGAGSFIYYVLKAPPPLPMHAQGLVLDNIVLINPGVEKRMVRRLSVRGDRISEIVDWKGSAPGYDMLFVMPGLTDMHVHDPVLPLPGHKALFAFLYLYHGVTAVRNTGEFWGIGFNAFEYIFQQQNVPSPRVYSCGPKINGNSKWWQSTLTVTSTEEAKRAVTDLVRRGYDCVKVYDDLTPEALNALYTNARDQGLPLIGHVPWRIPLDQAQINDVQHLLGFDVIDVEKHPVRPFRLLNLVEVTQPEFALFTSSLKERDIAVTPTLITLQRKFSLAEPKQLPALSGAQLLPSCYRDVYWDRKRGLTSATVMSHKQVEQFRQLYPKAQKIVMALYRAGVSIHSGTDTPTEFIVPGAGLLEELSLLNEVGLTAEQVLEIATRNSKNFLGAPELGKLEKGSPADFVIYKEDPTEDLTALTSIYGVVRDGRLYKREMLEAQLQIYRQWFQSPVYSLVTNVIFRLAIMVRSFIFEGQVSDINQ